MKSLAIIATIFVFQLCILNIFCDNSEENVEESSICESRDPSRDVAFVRLGRFRGFTDSGAEYQKTYLVSRYANASWFEAKTICKSFDLELASFETLIEAHTFLNMCENNAFINSFGIIHIHIDGMTNTPKSPTDWYWTNSGNKINFSIPWQPGQPDFFGDEYCLSFMSYHVTGFNDMLCEGYVAPFVCQRLDYFIPVRTN